MSDERLDTCIACLSRHAPQFAAMPKDDVAEVAAITVLAHAVWEGLSLNQLRDRMCKTHQMALAVGLRCMPDKGGETVQ